MNEVQALLSATTQVRYQYFIKRVADTEQVWGLYNKGWALTGDKYNNQSIPFWPKKEFAQHCADEEWKDYKPQAISIYDFIEKWLPGMEKDDIKPAIFWNKVDACYVSIPDLKDDLEQELAKYE